MKPLKGDAGDNKVTPPFKFGDVVRTDYPRNDGVFDTICKVESVVEHKYSATGWVCTVTHLETGAVWNSLDSDWLILEPTK